MEQLSVIVPQIGSESGGAGADAVPARETV